MIFFLLRGIIVGMRLKRFGLYLLLVLLVTYGLLGCAQKSVKPELLTSMGQLDRVFVPAFIFTELGRQRESEIAIDSLKGRWLLFYDRFANIKMKYGLNITDKFWQEDFENINRAVLIAEAYVSEGKFEEANAELNDMRVTLKNLRHRHGLEYFLDNMTEFDLAVKEMTTLLRGKNKLTDREMDKLRGYFKQAQKAWLQAESVQIDPEIFAFEPKKVKAIKTRVKAEEKILATFAVALSSRQMDRIAQASTTLRPNYYLLYKAFGDFQPIFDKLVQERKQKEKEEAEAKRASPEAVKKENKK